MADLACISKFHLTMQNIINYTDLIITIKSNLIKETINTKLGPNEEKTLTLTKKLDSLTPIFAITINVILI